MVASAVLSQKQWSSEITEKENHIQAGFAGGETWAESGWTRWWGVVGRNSQSKGWEKWHGACMSINANLSVVNWQVTSRKERQLLESPAPMWASLGAMALSTGVGSTFSLTEDVTFAAFGPARGAYITSGKTSSRSSFPHFSSFWSHSHYICFPKYFLNGPYTKSPTRLSQASSRFVSLSPPFYSVVCVLTVPS